MSGVSTEGEGVSTEGEGVSTEGEGVSTEGEGVSTEGEGVSTEGAGVSTEGEGVSTEGEGVSTEGAGTSTEEREHQQKSAIINWLHVQLKKVASNLRQPYWIMMKILGLLITVQLLLYDVFHQLSCLRV
ncbi:hypothetical protein SAMN05216232_2336 [Virgibacillus subterraneus]|uniref:Uncharacterized protein n=1 Tax=Virgibacillus subterraneus TaxID=621109 RepID=A0A1H9FUG1_9BACI|nr:hypothetical protein [Virgibacillus subterraneus]SEQ41580.1 hypothetical protein SAMN05216232_2336 [Virgibacillus subterraneus]